MHESHEAYVANAMIRARTILRIASDDSEQRVYTKDEAAVYYLLILHGALRVGLATALETTQTKNTTNKQKQININKHNK